MLPSAAFALLDIIWISSTLQQLNIIPCLLVHYEAVFCGHTAVKEIYANENTWLMLNI